MKFLDGLDIPIDGIAVTLATYVMSPPESKIKNSIVIALLHGFFHPREVNHEIQDHDASFTEIKPTVNNQSMQHISRSLRASSAPRYSLTWDR
jgi:hypothetical protein